MDSKGVMQKDFLCPQPHHIFQKLPVEDQREGFRGSGMDLYWRQPGGGGTVFLQSLPRKDLCAVYFSRQSLAHLTQSEVFLTLRELSVFTPFTGLSVCCISCLVLTTILGTP